MSYRAMSALRLPNDTLLKDTEEGSQCRSS